MKKCTTFVLISSIALITACKSPGNKTPEDNQNSDNKTVDNRKLPYTKEKNTDWEVNEDNANTLIVLNALKAIENKDYQALSNTTADSIRSDIDGLKFNGTKAQMMKANKDFFATLKNIRIIPQDWISVINKDKSQEWVRVWYTQYWEDLKGKSDSLKVFNDIKLKEGKINQWNEYIQHFPKP